MTDHTEIFNQYRSLLFSVAYRMLGSVMDAEDMVQEAYLRWQATDISEVDSPQAYLTTVVSRLCIDFLRSARARREEYVGPWLPEPLLTDMNPTNLPSEHALLAESLSSAFLLMLESLNPVERAVFLLHDVFDYGYRDIAAIVDRSEANCRQIGGRARQHIDAHRLRFEPSASQQNQLMQQFLYTVDQGDMDGLVNLLAEDVVHWSDGGGKAVAARRLITGADNVARFLIGLKRLATPTVTYHVRLINNQLGVLIVDGDRVISTLVPLFVEGRVQAIHAVLNPDKLQRIQEQFFGDSR